MTTDDDDLTEPTEEELREAEALARALERGHAPSGTPEDALATAAFLRHTVDGSALSPARAEAILEDALARARPPRRAPSLRGRLALVLGLATAATTAALVLVVGQSRESPAAGAASVASIPPPPRALLEAQMDVAGARVATLETLTTETRDYRRTLYGALHDRYGR